MKEFLLTLFPNLTAKAAITAAVKKKAVKMPRLHEAPALRATAVRQLLRPFVSWTEYSRYGTEANG